MSKKPELKEKLENRLKALLPDPKDFALYNETIHIKSPNWIRCNTLKISTENLFKRLSEKWPIEQPFPEYPEIMLVSVLEPGELGKSIEHILGYFYIQNLASMLPPIALDPKPEELVLDLTAAPGSKTTQLASYMENKGTIIANELKLGRLKVLSANLERCGVTNTIITKKDAVAFCSRLGKETKIRFDKILLDAPCGGEGTLRDDAKTFYMWNLKMVKKFSRIQKKLLATALYILKPGGTIIYSTCTHAPEENEEIINFALDNFPVKVETLSLPIKGRPGITNWGGSSENGMPSENKKYNPEVTKTCRVYPHDDNTQGFFLAKLTLLEEVKPR